MSRALFAATQNGRVLEVKRDMRCKKFDRTSAGTESMSANDQSGSRIDMCHAAERQ
jgi:hypothetical protein